MGYNCGELLQLLNIEIIERFQSEVLRIITKAPWFVPNNFIRHDLQILTVKEVPNFSQKYEVRLQ